MKRMDSTVKEQYDVWFYDETYAVVLEMDIKNVNVIDIFEMELPDKLHRGGKCFANPVYKDGAFVIYEDKFLKEVHIIEERGNDVHYEIRREVL